MALSLSAAAQLVGKHKVTLLRSIQAGRLSATKDDFGEWQLEPAEVTRLYTVKSDTPAHSEQGQQYASALEVEIRMLREIIATIEKERDRWHEQATAMTRVLPAPERRSFWSRISKSA